MTRHLVIDLSSNNEGLDIEGFFRAHPEVDGAIIKATEGNSYVNPFFRAQVDQVRLARKLTGVYTWEHPSNAGSFDMDKFIDVVGGTPVQLGSWLDCESSDNLDPGTVLTRVEEDLLRLDRQFPGHVGPYSGRWWWDPNTRGSVPAHMERWPLWLSWYKPTLPPEAFPAPWTNCRLWQFTDNYAGSKADCSIFMGSEIEWAAFTEGIHVPTKDSRVRDIQVAVRAVPDGDWGRDTDWRCETIRALAIPANRTHQVAIRNVQVTLGLATDGILGPITSLAWMHCVALMQKAFGVHDDGLWGRVTEAAYLAASPLR